MLETGSSLEPNRGVKNNEEALASFPIHLLILMLGYNKNVRF